MKKQRIDSKQLKNIKKPLTIKQLSVKVESLSKSLNNGLTIFSEFTDKTMNVFVSEMNSGLDRIIRIADNTNRDVNALREQLSTLERRVNKLEQRLNRLESLNFKS
jgi:vacuolar-type H+-ATPase subunit D/Vma8